MGLTIDVLRGRVTRYVTCDRCGLPILDRACIEPPAGARDYERYEHADGCPDEGGRDRDPAVATD